MIPFTLNGLREAVAALDLAEDLEIRSALRGVRLLMHLARLEAHYRRPDLGRAGRTFAAPLAAPLNRLVELAGKKNLPTPEEVFYAFFGSRPEGSVAVGRSPEERRPEERIREARTAVDDILSAWPVVRALRSVCEKQVAGDEEGGIADAIVIEAAVAVLLHASGSVVGRQLWVSAFFDKGGREPTMYRSPSGRYRMLTDDDAQEALSIIFQNRPRSTRYYKPSGDINRLRTFANREGQRRIEETQRTPSVREQPRGSIDDALQLGRGATRSRIPGLAMNSDGSQSDDLTSSFDHLEHADTLLSAPISRASQYRYRAAGVDIKNDLKLSQEQERRRRAVHHEHSEGYSIRQAAKTLDVPRARLARRVKEHKKTGWRPAFQFEGQDRLSVQDIRDLIPLLKVRRGK